MVSTHWGNHHRPSDRELRFLDLLARQAADLTESKLAQEKIQEQAALLDVVTEAIFVCDLGYHNQQMYWICLSCRQEMPNLIQITKANYVLSKRLNNNV